MLLITLGGYMLYGPTVIHFHETKCRSALAERAIKTGKEMADEQITQFAVSLATSLQLGSKFDDMIKSCEFQISLNRSWNFILWFVGFRLFSLAFVVR